MDSDTVPSTPRSTQEPTPETEYESRIANLDSTPTQFTTEYFSWRQLADMSGRLPELAEQFGAVTALCLGDYVALGTDTGLVVVTDYLGRTKAALGSPATAAYGPVSTLAFSTDHLVLVAGYAQGFVVVWDWVKGTTVSVSRPLQDSDKPDAAGHPAGTAITFAAFVGASKHRYISGSSGGHVLYHHIIRRLLTTMNTSQLAGPDSGILFEAAALPYGSHKCTTDDMGLVAILTDTSLTIVKTRHGVEQQYRASYQISTKPVQKRTVVKRPYAGCVSWLPALGYRRPATATDPAEPDYTPPKLAYSWGASIHILAIQLDYNVSGNGTPMGSVPPRVQFEREAEWTAVGDVVFCRWIEAGTLLYMTQSQRMFVLETALAQETEICASPPGSIAGRPWVTLATGVEAEPSYAQVISVYKRRVFALCGAASLYIGRLLSWTERLELLVERGQFIDAITLATGFYQERTGQVVVGLPRSRRPGDANQKKRQALVGSRLAGLMRSALKRTFDADHDHRPSTEPELHALASICVQACLALGSLQILFSDVFECYSTDSAHQFVFLETIEPFILSGDITHLPPQVLNAMVDSYGTTPPLIRRLGGILMCLNLQHGEFDVDRVLSSCRKHRLWRTFARVWLSMGDPIAPITSIIAAASQTNHSRDSSIGQTVGELTIEHPVGDDGFDDEAPDVVIFDYLDMVIRGRYYPDNQPIQPQSRAEKYSTLVAQLVFPPIETLQAQGSEQQTFATLLALLGLGTERLLDMLKHVLSDPFIGYINIIVKPPSTTQSTQDSDRTLRRPSQVKSLMQIVVDTLHTLTMAAYTDPAGQMLSARQIGQLTSFALTLYATRFPLIYLTDETMAEWSDVLLRLDDVATRAERECAFELLFKLNPPRSYGDYIDRVRSAGFFRVLEHIYYTLEQYENALRTFLDHPDFTQHRMVFPAMKELGASKRPNALECTASFALNSATELVEVDADSFVETVAAIASLDHGKIIDTLSTRPQLQFAYMRSLLDPAPDAISQSPGPRTGPVLSADERSPPNIGLSEEQHMVVYPLKSLVPDDSQPTNRFSQAYHERYLELMCQYSPSGVLPYLKKHADLSPEPFRLTYVQSVCGKHGVSDGLVWALVRLGDFSGALQTLLQQTDQEIESIKAAVPDDRAGSTFAQDIAAEPGPPALTEADRERLTDHLDIAAHNIDGCVGVCRAALAKLGKDADLQPGNYLGQGASSPTANGAAARSQSDYRSLVSAQLCDLWLALLRRTLGYLHTTNRTLDALPPGAATETREAWQLVSKRQRWMLQSVLDALIFAASPASSFISLRAIIQQLITTSSTAAATENNNNARQSGAARSLDITEIQHLLAVAVSAYKTEAQLMALTNVLVDYDLFTTFAQLVRSQKQGWRVAPDSAQGAGGHALASRDVGDLCCAKCHSPLFVDRRQEHAMAELRRQTTQYYESSALRVLDLHVFEDRDAQWQWMKLRTDSTAYDRLLGQNTHAGAGAAAAADAQVVLFKCGHGFHRHCVDGLAAKGLAAADAPLPECAQCADAPASMRCIGAIG
ncbi:hypothetical protein H4S02_002598 [Coemansia sp. RSA 2611]|nr:hypothetical protein H4S02_002598 [Coemansia sp. RSA 2611]